jgi:hypothetical protein
MTVMFYFLRPVCDKFGIDHAPALQIVRLIRKLLSIDVSVLGLRVQCVMLSKLIGGLGLIGIALQWFVCGWRWSDRAGIHKPTGGIILAHRWHPS